MEKLESRKQSQGSVPPVRGASLSTAKPAGQGFNIKSSASVVPNRPTETLSYKERLAIAAKQQEEKKHMGVIVHKPRQPVVEKKEWQKKLEEKKARQQPTSKATGPDRKSKSPGVASGDKLTVTKKPLAKDSGKSGTIAKKANIDSRRSSVTNTKSKPADKTKLSEPVKRKRSPSPISWRGRNAAPAPAKKPNRAKNGRSRYDDDDDDDDDSWIVDDDEDEDDGRGRQSSYSRR